MHCVKCGAPTFPTGGSTAANTLCPTCKNKAMHGPADAAAHAERQRRQHAAAAAAVPTIREEPTVRTGPVVLTEFPRYMAIHTLIARLKTASPNDEYQAALAALEGHVNALATEGLGPRETGPIEPVMVAAPAAPAAPHVNSQPATDPVAALVDGQPQG